VRCRRVCLPIAISVMAGLVIPLSTAQATTGATANSSPGTRLAGVHPTSPRMAPARLSAAKVPQGALEAANLPQGIAPPTRGSGSLHGLRRIDATSSRQNAEKIGSAYAAGPIYATPPSPSIGVGPTRVLEAVNGSVAYYDKATGVALNRESLDVLAGYLGEEIASSPQVVYDVRSSRWFVSVAFTEYDATPTFVGSRIVLLVSKNNAPASMADFTVRDVTTSTTTLLDEPLLAVTADKVVVRTNSYDPSSLAPSGTDLWIMNLAALVPPDPNNPPALVVSKSSFNTAHEGMAVASSYGTSPGDADTYLTYWQNSGATPTANLGVIRVSGAAAPYTVTDSTVPTPTGGAPVPPTPVAVPAPASTGVVPIYAGDFQPVSAVARGSGLWSASVVTCTPDGDTTVRDCVRVVGSSTGASPALTVDETYSRLGSDLWAPAVTVDSANDLHLTANVVSAGSTVGVLHDLRSAAGSWLAAPMVRWSGVTYHPLAGVDDVASGATSLYWSARASAVPDSDPANSDVWTAAETVAPYAAATYPSGGNWADTVWRVGSGRTLSASPLTRTPSLVTYWGISKLATSVNVSGTGIGRNWPVRLESRAHGVGSYLPSIYSASTTAGAFAYSVRPALSTDYRVAVLDPVTGAPWAYSSAAALSVRWAVTLKPSASSRRHGARILFTGKVGPAVRVAVYLQRYSGGAWRTLGLARTNSASAYGISSVLLKGRWYYRVYVPSYANRIAAFSASVRVTGT